MATPQERALELQKAAERQRQLRIDYGTVFGSLAGQRVLEDLKKRYGWNGAVENPSARVGARAEDVFLIDGMKEPVRHILAMLQPVDEQPKPTEAHANE